jgi:hypothetical protein
MRQFVVTCQMHAPGNDSTVETKVVTMGGRIMTEYLIIQIPYQRRSIDTSLPNNEILLMTEMSWKRRQLLCDRVQSSCIFSKVSYKESSSKE